MAGNTVRVLVFEDDREIAQQLREYLERRFARIEVLVAHTLSEAIGVFDANAGRLDAVIADIIDDTLNRPVGINLARRAQAEGVPAIVMSRHDPEDFRDAVHGVYPVAFIVKEGDYYRRLVAELRVIVALRGRDPVAARQEDEARDLCLCATPMVLIRLRFELGPLPVADVPRVTARLWSVAPVAVGVREFSTHVRAAGGQMLSPVGQTVTAAFAGDKPVVAALAAVRGTWQALRNTGLGRLKDYGFYNKPFRAALVSGTVAAGLFGERFPGVAGLVGPLAEALSPLTRVADIAEVVAIKEWLEATGGLAEWNAAGGASAAEVGTLREVEGSLTLLRKPLA
jgi:CheY-like chemotaxis protein